MMQVLRTLSRILVGLVFVFSGFVKAVDPLGSNYKFTDYFNAFGMPQLAPLAMGLAFFLSAIELTMGISLLLSYRMKIVSWAILVFMSFFTILTFILAIFNPVTDCGCFGDALILTNWQTFWKNVILMVFTILIFTGRHKFLQIRSALAEWGILSFFFAAVIGLSMYCRNHLPILDFMPYKTGTNIPAASIVPENAPRDVYETKLYYKNKVSGKISEFTIENFPKDSIWEFSDSKSVLISKGYEPPIHDFSIMAPNGEDITPSIKNNPDFSFLVISYNLQKADKQALQKANEYYRLSGIFKDVKFYAVTASLATDIKSIRDSFHLQYDLGSADEIALKTMIRSNPGLILLKNGTIIGKWHYNDFPDAEQLSAGFDKMIQNFPMTPGVDLREMKAAPEGSRNDVYKTSLVYRNTRNDSISVFTMENFPRDAEWEFVSSKSEKITSGYSSPVADFKMITPEGTDISDRILQQNDDVFLISAKEPQNLDIDLLERLNKLSVVGASLPDGPVFFYAVTGLSPEQIYGFTDSFITPITFCSGSPDFIESISGKGVSLIHLRNGRIAGRWDNTAIPGPDDLPGIVSNSSELKSFETSIMPYLVSSYRTSIEEKRVYILILGFLFITLFIRVFLEDPFRNQK